tara:strand:+ start:23377 stop:23841 length:465 start_codon:yes stop_codon:yes gene_type:complete
MQRTQSTSSATQCRYGLWHSKTCTLHSDTAPIDWRQTPKSKKYVAIVPTLALPCAMEVLGASENEYDVRLIDESIHFLHQWCNYPSENVLPFTVANGNVVRLQGPCAVQDKTYTYTDKKIQKGDWIMGRVRVSIHELGSHQHKTNVTLVDAVIL